MEFNIPKESYKRISFCFDQALYSLLDRVSLEFDITRSLLIRSILWNFLQKNHQDLILRILTIMNTHSYHRKHLLYSRIGLGVFLR